MRLHSLFILGAASALLLPLTANAEWPAGKKGPYMDQCVQVAMGQGLDTKTADIHCKCGADAIEKNFTAAEINALDSKNGVDAKLMQRAQTAVTQACAKKS